MTFRDLVENITVQGDVRISVWNLDEEVNVQYFNSVLDFYDEMNAKDDRWDMDVTYIFCPGDGYLHVELVKEE